MSKLAILGGKPVRSRPFPGYNSIGEEEKRAVMDVLDTGRLSEFIGRRCEYFGGGKKVLELEALVQERFGVRHAVSMNSATSCIYAALGAIGIGAGDEVIVSPYSMCISATAPFLYQAIPVFADLEPDHFCLDPESVRRNITPRTRAILTVDTFGQSSAMEELRAIANEHGLKIIVDCAHAMGVDYLGQPAGTQGDIGIYSLNAHKIIQCGEGGLAVTNDDELALKLKLIRNHAEAAVEDFGVDLVNMLGQNYRMPEMEAAIAIEQIKKLDGLIAQRVELSEHLSRRLAAIDGLTPPAVRPGATHAYYIYPIKYDQARIGVPRERILDALRAEGIPMYRFAGGYVRPQYYEAIFREKTVFAKGLPFSLPHCERIPDYSAAAVPVIEKLYREEMIVFHLIYPPLTIQDMDEIADAFEKVFSHVDDLRCVPV